jgi:hypothetical protein
MQTEKKMKYNKSVLIVLLMHLVLLLDGISSIGHAASSSAVRSLAGVNTFRVIAEDLSEAMQKTGLRKEQLEGSTTEALQKNGFTVLKPQDPGKVPVVYVRLSSVFANDSGTGPLSFYLTLQVKQPATLAYSQTPANSQVPKSQSEPPLIVSTWEGGTMAMVNREEMVFYLERTLLNLIGDLTSDHQEANSQKVSRAQ